MIIDLILSRILACVRENDTQEQDLFEYSFKFVVLLGHPVPSNGTTFSILDKLPSQRVPPGEKGLSFESKPLAAQDLSRTSKEVASSKPDTAMRALLVEQVPRSLPSPVPLDLKIASPLQNRVSSVDQYTTSPLAEIPTMSAAPSEGRTSPAYSDISDDDNDEVKTDNMPKDLPAVDKPGYGFPFLGPVAPFGLMGPMVDVDRKGNSPADQGKGMIPMAPFPGFIYPVVGGRPSDTFSPTFNNLSQSPQPKLSDSVDLKREPSSSSSPLYGSKSSSRSKETDKADGKGRGSVAKDPLTKNDVKSDPGKVKDEFTKSTAENDTKPLMNGIDRPQAYPTPPAYMLNGAYRSNASQSFPLPMPFMNGPRAPPMFGPEQFIQAMYYNAARSPAGLPPGLPQLPSQDSNAMDMMQQVLILSPQQRR